MCVRMCEYARQQKRERERALEPKCKEKLAQKMLGGENTGESEAAAGLERESRLQMERDQEKGGRRKKKKHRAK